MEITKEILLKYQDCKTSEAEESEILKWLAASPENRKKLDEMDFLNNAIILNAPGRIERPKRNPKKRNTWHGFVLYASVCAVSAAIFFAGWKVVPKFTQKPVPTAVNMIDVPFGQRTNLTLQDGTVVCLNSGSHLEFPAVFGEKTRTVKLAGEAMFDVVKDPDHPFIVETFACNVQALGTKFDVNADEARQFFSSSLIEGKVLVTRNDDESKVALLPGEKVELRSGSLNHCKVTTNDDYLWTMGIISLGGHSFADLMERFESIYGYRVIYLTNSVPNIRCHGKIRISDGIDHAMMVLKLSGTKFDYEINHNLNEIYISIKP